ncbi:cytochrome c oxidase subunit 3 [Mesorhizobium sp. CO1-1-8]|uniref:cytochrome c oxidase subunit 3 n=1 Tax=Mesorhizobium sp. CO1-1-8 TaxID=2876631 RepID=UPI001CD19278|nr:cytochrome c oxidase subunit 3 [Mesorhizobium sp. CO1-1-8]MBZ9776846.1 cytochrome c oxidase subunit 3 [Mesorhizobium sp. CO1-1-8]
MTATESIAFRDAERERVADALGMWVFLISEAMLFGGLILIYTAARIHSSETFGEASKHLSVLLGTANTAILITSSLTMALAHWALQDDRPKASVLSLLATAVLGTAFLSIKGYEYFEEAQENVAPVLGLYFHWQGAHELAARHFFQLYFAMTGLHALHLFSGVVVVLGIAASWKWANPSNHLRRVRAVGFYWHFIDIVWVILFPLLYLVSRA